MKNKTIFISVFLVASLSSLIYPVSFGQQNDNVLDNNETKYVTNYNAYHVSDKYNNEYTRYQINNIELKKINNNLIRIIQTLNGPPMNSPWPMYCHDIRHTGQSPYSTAGNSFYNNWWFRLEYGFIEGSGVIDNEGIIYFGSWNNNLYAMYPNGTLKWVCNVGGNVESSPVIDENGTIYVGIAEQWGHLSAINPDGTLKWTYSVSDEILSSPAIGSDGTIYFGDGAYYINALYPNGTLKWRYKTGLVVYSSPAIGNDGTVYCGSHDTYLYAFYPDNGTMKWKYKAGDWIRVSPCIDDDGTIYVVSLDNYLHAVNPDGTLKWKTYVGAGTSPTIGQDGTIYAGYRTLYAVNPTDGSVKWTFAVGGTMCGGTPCNSIDGTIFVGTSDGCELIAINPDGTERWRTSIGTCEFAPIIGEDGTVYVGASTDEFTTGPGGCIPVGYLYAFNNMDPDVPSAPEINGPTEGKKEVEYQYTFKSTSPVGRDFYYYIEWGDGDWTTEWWIGPYGSGEEVVLNHIWPEEEVYTIRARCKDTENLWGPWGELTVSTPFDLQISKSINQQINQHSSNQLLLKILGQFMNRSTLIERLLNIQ